MTRDQERAIDRARTIVFNRRAQYNRAWRKEPTAKGYPRVDLALDKLEAAEREFAATVEDASRTDQFKL